MLNARQELEEHLKEWNLTLLAAEIQIDNPKRNPILYPDHTEEELATFYEQLDFEYDNGYGSQNIFGILWFTNGHYSDRLEYDGSECWQYHEPPSLPKR